MTIAVAGLVGGLLLLFLGGEAVVRGAASLGLRLGLTPLVTGLTVVAFGTSAPELMVSLQATMSGESGLAVGNVVGSNIANIGLILGLSVLIRPAVVDSRLVIKEVPIMIASGVLVALLLLNGVLSRLDGAVLVTLMIGYIAYSVYGARRARRRTKREFEEALLTEGAMTLGRSALLTIIGLGLLVLGGRFFVQGAIAISSALGVSPAVIGLSVAAIGTSLPELATSVVAAARGYGDMAAGNVIGSNIFNSLSVLGLTAVTMPVGIGAVGFLDLAVMIGASVLMLRLMHSKSRMERWEGAVLLAGFAGYIAWLFI